VEAAKVQISPLRVRLEINHLDNVTGQRQKTKDKRKKIKGKTRINNKDLIYNKRASGRGSFF
jgi:hypothetical protein